MEDVAVFDFTKKKKKDGKKKKKKEGDKKKVTKEETEVTKKEEALQDNIKQMEEQQRVATFEEERRVQKQKDLEQKANFKDPFTYEFLLERIYGILQKNNPNLFEKTKFVLKQPNIQKIQGKRSEWANFKEICDGMNRIQQHVYDYFLAELGTEGSLTEGKLIFKGAILQKNIEYLIKKYIFEYVQCPHCKTQETILEKDQHLRQYVMKCQRCQGSKTVAAIKQGYRAVKKGERKRAKQ